MLQKWKDKLHVHSDHLSYGFFSIRELVWQQLNVKYKYFIEMYVFV